MTYRWWSTGLVLMMGCGSQVTETPGSTSGDSTSSSSGSTEASSGPSTGATSSSEDGSGSTGYPAVCDEYADEALPPTSETVLEFRNETNASLLLETNCGLDFLTVSNDAGWRWPGDFCSETCQQQFQWGCSVCDGCASDSYEVVGPGGVLTIEWAGHLFDRGSPPAECQGEYGLCGPTCEIQRDASPAGEVQVRIVAVRQAACEAAAEDPQWCACPAEMTCDYSIPSEGFSASAEFIATGLPGGTIVVEALD